MKYVNVTHEYGELKEVIIGTARGIRMPRWDSKLSLADVFAFLPEDARGRVQELNGQMLEDVNPEAYASAVRQMDSLADFLTARGIAVHRPEPYTDGQYRIFDEYSTLTFSMFTRDPVIIIGNKIIETALRQPYRNKERWPLRKLLCDLSKRSGTEYVSMPFPFPVRMDEADRQEVPLLEGGDVLVFGKDILVGYNGRAATSVAGIEWLRNYLGREYRIHPVKLAPDVLHLDDGLAAVRDGLAIIMREQFIDGIPDFLRNWDFIEVNKYEALNNLAANPLVLRSGELILDSRAGELAEKLAARSVIVHLLEYDAVTPYAGGFRCSHHPVVREI